MSDKLVIDAKDTSKDTPKAEEAVKADAASKDNEPVKVEAVTAKGEPKTQREVEASKPEVKIDSAIVEKEPLVLEDLPIDLTDEKDSRDTKPEPKQETKPEGEVEARTARPDNEPEIIKGEEPKELKDDRTVIPSINKADLAEPTKDPKEEGKDLDPNNEPTDRQDRQEDRERDGAADPIDIVEDTPPGNNPGPDEEELKAIVGVETGGGSDSPPNNPSEGSTPPPAEATDFINDANNDIEEALRPGELSESDVVDLLDPSVEADMPDLPTNPYGQTDPSKGFDTGEHPGGGVNANVESGGDSSLTQDQYISGYNNMIDLRNTLVQQVRDGDATAEEQTPVIAELDTAIDNFEKEHNPENVWVLESGGNLKDNLENGSGTEKAVAWGSSPVKGDEVYTNYVTGELSDKASLPEGAHVTDGRSTIDDQETGAPGAGTSRTADMGAWDFVKAAWELGHSDKKSDNTTDRPDPNGESEAAAAEGRAFEADNGLGGHNVGLPDEINIIGDYVAVDTTSEGETDDSKLTGGDDPRAGNQGGGRKEGPNQDGVTDPSQDDDINTSGDGDFLDADTSVGGPDIQGTDNLGGMPSVLDQLTDNDPDDLDLLVEDPDDLDTPDQPLPPQRPAGSSKAEIVAEFGGGDSEGSDPTEPSSEDESDSEPEAFESNSTSDQDAPNSEDPTAGEPSSESEGFEEEEIEDDIDDDATDDVEL